MEGSQSTEKKILKVLIVSNEFPPGPGGLGTHAFEVAQQLSRVYSVTVICAQHYKEKKEIDAFNRRQPFPVLRYPDGGSLMVTAFRKVNFIRKTLLDVKPDVVIPSGSNSIWMVSFLKGIYGFRQLTIVHGGELTFKTWWRRKLTLMGCNYSERLISVSRYTAGFLFRYGIPESRVTVIPNGANATVCRTIGVDANSLKKKYGYEGRRVILTVGSVSERKGQDIVIKAMHEISSVISGVIYVMVGRSNNYDFFRKAAEDAGVASNVVFFGVASVEQVVDLYNLADVFILNSRHSSDGDFEGFGIAVIEAALCRVPAVVTSDSGLVEAIEEGVTGVSVPPENPGETAKAILSLLTNNPLREKMAQAAFDRAHKDFTWEKVGEKYRTELENMKLA